MEQLKFNNITFNIKPIKNCKKLSDFIKKHSKYNEKFLEDVYYMVHDKPKKKKVEDEPIQDEVIISED